MVLLPLFLAAQAALAPHLEARRTLAPPRLDGRLDDAAWRGAPASEAFTQKRPAPGAAPVERTRFRVLYDDDAIYVGVECDQTRAPVVARLTRRDREIEADAVTVSLDTRGDGRTAFEFAVRNHLRGVAACGRGRRRGGGRGAHRRDRPSAAALARTRRGGEAAARGSAHGLQGAAAPR